ncbi:MAG: PKD domain-containing protein [Bifidobacteriaceae bacterium]|jgi:PKD repeat protein|nr:PKD domain-containing protein [Bifidobacteriaceae bacterium]
MFQRATKPFPASDPTQSTPGSADGPLKSRTRKLFARRWTRAVAVGLTSGLVLTAALAAPAPPSRADAAHFEMSQLEYGPNEDIFIEYGVLTPGCDTLNIVQSDLYIVRHGTVGAGSKLTDVAGAPTVAIPMTMGSYIGLLTIGYTAPGGKIGRGEYDVVEDVCQDGYFDGPDTILSPAFKVADPDPLRPPDPAAEAAIRDIKDAAAARAQKKGLAWALVAAARLGARGRYTYYKIHLSILKEVTLWSWSIDVGIANDPPDPAFTQAVSAPPIDSYEETDNGTELGRAYQSLYYAAANEAAAAEGFLHALEKYQGAEGKLGTNPDASAALAQAKAISAYARQAVKALEAGQGARAAAIAAGIDDRWTAADHAQAQAVRQRLRAGGSFTSDELGLLASHGITGQAELAQLAQELASDDTYDEAYQSFADWDAEETAKETDLADAFEGVAALFDGFAAQLTADMTAAGYAFYPTVTVAGPAQATLGDTIALTAATNAANTVAWDTDADGQFDDGTGTTASVAASHLGLTRIGAKVTDPTGKEAVGYSLVDVSYPAGHPVITATDPAAGTELPVGHGDTKTLTVTPGHTQGKAVTVTWYVNGQAVGTGNTLTVTGSSAKSPQDVQAKVTDASGLYATASWDLFTIQVSPPPAGTGPAAAFVFDPANPNVGAPVSFTDSSQASAGRTVAAWAWDFDGNGSVDSTAQNPQWTYSTPGAYPVSLTVTDSEGDQDTATVTVVASNPSYLTVYPVAGTMSKGQVTVRVKAWAKSGWTELSGAQVVVSVGTHSVTVTTGADGVAEARVPVVAGTPVTAELIGAADGSYGPALDSNDLSAYGKPQGDVVFVVDESWTMGAYQDAVAANLNVIAGTLAQSIDYQLGLVGFGAYAHSNEVEHIDLPATDSLADFAAATSRLERNGANEWGTDAIVYALGSRVGVRPEAATCLVLLADEHTQIRNVSVAETAQALADNDATLFSVINPRVDTIDYQNLATGSGGEWFDIAQFAADPQGVLDGLLAGCVASVTQRPDLSVTVDDGLTQVPLDGAGTFTVTVTNDGLVDATGVDLVLESTSPFTLGAISGSGTAAAPTGGGGDVVTWPSFGLAAGDSVSFTVGWSPLPGTQPGDVVSVEARVEDDGLNGADLSPANNQASDSTTVVAIPTQPVSVVYVDDAAAGAPVVPLAGTRTALVGPRLSPVGFTEAEARAGVPAGYVFVSLDNVATFDDDDSQAQTITVHLAHHHTQSSLAVTRTIEYLGAGAATPAPVAEDLLWYADADDVTGDVVYSTPGGYSEVASPVVPGFTADPLVVEATAPVASTSVRPVDTVVTVVYLAGSEQLVSVVYVDDDLGGAPVVPVAGSRTALIGARLSPVGFTEADALAGVPAGYVFASLDNVATFDDDENQAQTITVHLTHHHTLSTLVVTRVVQYTGAGDSTPEPVEQEVLWYADTDDVTGVTVYWSSEGYPEVATPDVDGHTPDRDLVEGTGPVGQTTLPPTDTVELVEYEPAQEPEPTPTPTPTPSGSAPPAPPALPITGPGGAAGVAALAALLLGLGAALVRARQTKRHRATL